MKLQKKSKYNVAVMGATGAVGTQFLKILEERDFPINQLKPLASERSRGKYVQFKGDDIPVEVLSEKSFNNIDIVLSSAGAARSIEYLPSAVKSGALCIDNSSAFRMEKDVPLIVPEVNPNEAFKNSGIIANPNCSTIQLVTALWPLHCQFKIKRVVVSTFQSVSGAGQKKILELYEQQTYLATKQTEHYQVGRHNLPKELIKEFNAQIACNLIPHIDVFQDNLYTKEEMKMVNESRKIMSLPELALTATCVRVPVFFAHSESVNIEFERPVSAEDAKSILEKSPGITLIDDPDNSQYPMPLFAEGKNDVFVGRIRKDTSSNTGINLWVVSDNLRKGAALNAIQIAELFIN